MQALSKKPDCSGRGGDAVQNENDLCRRNGDYKAKLTFWWRTFELRVKKEFFQVFTDEGRQYLFKKDELRIFLKF